MKYIDSGKLKKYIENKRNVVCDGLDWDDMDECQRYAVEHIDDIIAFIDSLQQEQPEVDLDDVIENYILENFGERWDGCVPIGCFELDLMAEHFYKLGLNAKKEN